MRRLPPHKRVLVLHLGYISVYECMSVCVLCVCVFHALLRGRDAERRLEPHVQARQHLRKGVDVHVGGTC